VITNASEKHAAPIFRAECITPKKAIIYTFTAVKPSNIISKNKASKYTAGNNVYSLLLSNYFLLSK
jgi:hypothetical protein